MTTANLSTSTLYRPSLKLAIVGHGRSGKDTAAEWFHRHTTIRYGVGTSWIICEHVAAATGRSVQDVFDHRHGDRPTMRRIGDELRESDPAYLARETLKRGDIANGIRARIEIEATQRERLVDLTIWIDSDVPEDPTLEFDASVADIIVHNPRTPLFFDRLRRLAKSWNVLRP
jgi:hypothetical protein